MFLQELGNGRNARFGHLHQLDGRAFQFLGSLNEVAAVGPEEGFRFGDQRRAGRTGESGDVYTGLEMISHIFVLMEVVSRDDIECDIVLLHLLPKSSESFRYWIHCDISPFNETALPRAERLGIFLQSLSFYASA